MTETGEKISYSPDGNLNVPDRPVIPFIEGDGTGPDIWAATRVVLEAAVDKAYANADRVDKVGRSAGRRKSIQPVR